MRQAREHWHTKRQPRMCREPYRLVFLDETGTSTKMTHLRGCGLTQTFVAGLQPD